MSVTLHVPHSFTDFSNLKELLSTHRVGIETLHSHSNSLYLHGDMENINNVLDVINSQYPDEGIVALRGDHAPKLKSPVKYHASSNSGSTTYTAPQIGKIYGFPTDQQKRANIAIIELGGGYKQSDLDAYWRYIGVSPPTVIPVTVDGVGNTPGSDADGEVVLDIEVIGGLVPNSNIYVYFAPNTDQGFYDAIHAAIYDTVHNPSVISISWGGPENQWNPTQLIAYNSLFQVATRKGINICVASGDNGSSDGEKTGLHVDFPGSSPFVLSCGGTNLVCPSGTYDSNTKEICWGGIANDGAGGGGYSTVFARPYYQNSVKVITKTRGVPDVAGVADPITGWQIYLNGQMQVIGGTSAVAPLWAAYLAKMGIKTFINEILYTIGKKGFHDITQGLNGAYKATIGWDPVTGLGSLNGNVLNKILQPYRSN